MKESEQLHATHFNLLKPAKGVRGGGRGEGGAILGPRRLFALPEKVNDLFES